MSTLSGVKDISKNKSLYTICLAKIVRMFRFLWTLHNLPIIRCVEYKENTHPIIYIELLFEEINNL